MVFKIFHAIRSQAMNFKNVKIALYSFSRKEVMAKMEKIHENDRYNSFFKIYKQD